jgi:uncharacterized protein with HEPN domain
VSARDAECLKHVLAAIERILKYLANVSEQQFLADELVQDAVVRNLEIVGEAASRLSPALTESSRSVPWRAIAGMRNRLIHAYFGVDPEMVWATVSKDLPPLRSAVEKLLHAHR